MTVHELAWMTWRDVEALGLRGHASSAAGSGPRAKAAPPGQPPLIAVLPVGAVEAHGPHLPLATDLVIARAMTREGAALLAEAGCRVLILPPLAYTPAPFAAGFPGTVSIRPETLVALLQDVGRSLHGQGVSALAIANAHLDPAHLGALHRGVVELAEDPGLPVAFPDLTRKPWALRLGDEFRSGAAHAGRYETSVVMSERPDAVREGVRQALAENPASLSRAIRSGAGTFEEAGGELAYFGSPADATPGEGAQTGRSLGQILFEAVRTVLGTFGGETLAREGS